MPPDPTPAWRLLAAWRGSARVAADLAVQADGIVLVAHHQEHRVAGAVGQPSQHRQQLAHAGAGAGVGVHRELGAVFLGARHGQHQAGV